MYINILYKSTYHIIIDFVANVMNPTIMFTLQKDIAFEFRAFNEASLHTAAFAGVKLAGLLAPLVTSIDLAFAPAVEALLGRGRCDAGVHVGGRLFLRFAPIADADTPCQLV